MERLDDDILMEILSRLSVTNLTQLKCVKKHWCTLISSPEFAKAQLTRALQQQPTHSPKLLLGTTPFETIDLELLGEIGVEKYATTELGYLSTIPERSIKFVGSCNGLVAMLFDGLNWILSNPTIREYVELPKPRHITKTVKAFYGLGYDPSSDDYKIVRGYCAGRSKNGDDQSSQEPTRVDIYSGRANSWQRAKDTHHRAVENDNVGAYYNGRLTWLFRDDSETDPNYRIATFNLGTEEFSDLIPLPNFEGRSGCRLEGIETIGDELLLYGSWSDYEFVGWMLYGPRTWSKIYDYASLNRSSFRVPSERTMWINLDGRIIVSACANKFCDLCICDPIDDSVVMYNFHQYQHSMDTCIYMESLVSPKFSPRQRRGMELREKKKIKFSSP